ncbi:MAG TPA: flagellar assembly protein FliW [Clostridiaceae bacterium]|nr:flagellar assembly protein FliW [Clostridiaceae bacterium]
MQLNTKHFGTIEIEESGIIEFPNGIPGFESSKNFIILGDGDENSPFKWLQSVDTPELAFAVVDPLAVKKDYDIEISDDVLEQLEIDSLEEVLVYSIVVVPEDLSKISMNLKAPVVINTRKKKGAQVVLDTDRYGVRHYILEELRRQEELDNACFDKKEEPIHCYK